MKPTIDRRQFLALTAAGAATAVLGGGSLPAAASADAVAKEIEKFTGGAKVAEGKVTLFTPEIAENGNSVPIEVSVESPMTAADHVQSVKILAEGNPNPAVVTFHFTPTSGEASAKTRIRLAKTQNVVAVAKMSDGSFVMAKNQVKVTIGGCGG